MFKEKELESQNGCVSYRFLESKIITEKNVTTVLHWNKNNDEILAHGWQKFPNRMHDLLETVIRNVVSYSLES